MRRCSKCRAVHKPACYVSNYVELALALVICRFSHELRSRPMFSLKRVPRISRAWLIFKIQGRRALNGAASIRKNGFTDERRCNR